MRPDPALETWTRTTGYPRLVVSCEKCTPTVALVAEIPIMRLSRPKPAAIMDVRRGQVPPPRRAQGGGGLALSPAGCSVLEASFRGAALVPWL
ncbi:hypothetical protein ACCO45_007855 [Purpureocillium lilacinum]|uniref:Uncharacterized protein n=1 Tax=Purpureocillium lilacinum TaxID=33203 RepID=A0ACC4DLM2_PURLI